MSRTLKLSAFVMLTTVLAFAADEPQTVTEQVNASAPAAQGSVFGNLQLRPTLTTQTGQFTTDNSWELGYRFTPSTSVNVFNKIKSNLYKGSRDGSGGADLYTDELYARAKFDNLWQDESKAWAFGIHQRVYAPINSSMIDSGMITGLRTYFNISRKLAPSTTVILSYIPVVHVYSKDSFNGAANKSWENRVGVTGIVGLTSKLRLELPVTLYQKKYRDVAQGVANNDAWVYELEFWPEIYYSLTEKVQLGGAFHSGNLLKTDFSGLAIGDGLEKNATVQFILSASI